MKDYKYYLFDADGTLFDTTEMIYRCFEHSFDRFKLRQVPSDLVYTKIGLPLRQQLEVYAGPVSDEFYEEYRSVHMTYQLSIYKDFIKLFPNVSDTLYKLKACGKRCAVVSSRLKDTLILFLEETNISHYFDIIMSPEGTAFHKPHPEPAVKVLEQFGCRRAEEGLFIGDASFDIECGAAAGMDTAFVEWSRCKAELLPVKPTYVIKEMKELLTRDSVEELYD
ncbi:MAG: HAD hydrolase-like protein [Chitinispirillales bacterium]|jgi:pyrophosphatase PpaX|nr:HAD hydrolase-like protein [Chitinispirillales bacterium]